MAKQVFFLKYSDRLSCDFKNVQNIKPEFRQHHNYYFSRPLRALENCCSR